MHRPTNLGLIFFCIKNRVYNVLPKLLYNKIGDYVYVINAITIEFSVNFLKVWHLQELFVKLFTSLTSTIKSLSQLFKLVIQLNLPVSYIFEVYFSNPKVQCKTIVGIKAANPIPLKTPLIRAAAPNIPAVEAYCGSTSL